VNVVEPIVVKKRFGQEWTDIREFVRPNDYMVAALVDSKPTWTILEAWEWVLNNIRYPSGVFSDPDRHRHSAYGMVALPVIGPLISSRKYTTGDYWNFPAETLRDSMGDCEDSSFLLTSMLRRIDPSMEAYSTVGYFDAYGHVWTTILRNGEWLVLDTTLDRMPQLVPTERSRPMYRPLFRFNERDIAIVDPNFADLPILHERGKDSAIQTWYAVLAGDYRVRARI